MCAIMWTCVAAIFMASPVAGFCLRVLPAYRRDPADTTILTFDEAELSELLAQRADARADRDFKTADAILLQLRSEMQVDVNDRTCEWRAGYTAPSRPAAGTKRQRPNPELDYRGDSKIAEQLGAALLTQWRGDGRRRGQTWTHGFHPSKALMEPLCVSQLLALLPGAGAVLDPFVGSGTTMIEAMVSGRAAVGCDLSPLNVGIARQHCWLPSPVEVEELRAGMAKVAAALEAEEAEEAEEAVAEQANPAVVTERPADAADFARARQLVDAADLPQQVSAAAYFVLSHEELTAWPAWRKPRPLSWRLTRTTSRYLRALESLRQAVPHGTPSARIDVCDARQLPISLREDDNAGPLDGVLTSPPYPGVYDYLDFTPEISLLAEHVVAMGSSMACVGTPQASPAGEPAKQALEIGSRAERDMLEADPTLGSFAERWQADTVQWLEAAARLLRTGGRMAILIGDDSGINTLESICAAAETISRRHAPSYTLRVVASASLSSEATRPWAKQSSRGRGYRREHTILLERVDLHEDEI